jgi:hypothetical protein
MATDDRAEMAIDNGEVVEVAARVKVVEQLMNDRGYPNLKSFTGALRRFLMKGWSVVLIAARGRGTR